MCVASMLLSLLEGGGPGAYSSHQAIMKPDLSCMHSVCSGVSCARGQLCYSRHALDICTYDAYYSTMEH